MTQIYRLNTVWDAKGKSVRVQKEVLGTDVRLIDAWEVYREMGYSTKCTRDENLTIMVKGHKVVYLEVILETELESNDWTNSVVV